MKLKAYYNEFDPSAAAWLRELIKMKLITDGEVDERSIADVVGSDVRGFDRVHFFAGIGGWELALQLAGFTGRIWTGSCPCQPFSSAGNQKGKSDERHLWPHMYRLIRECRPGIVLGEQVDGAIKHGWLDDLCDDLERENYAIRAQVLAAACVGAPHIRKRLYWGAFRTADTTSKGLERNFKRAIEGMEHRRSFGCTDDVRLSNSSSQGLQRHGGFEQESVQTGRTGEERHAGESGSRMGNTCGARRPQLHSEFRSGIERVSEVKWECSSVRDGADGWLANASVEQTIASDEGGFYAESSGSSWLGNAEHNGQSTSEIRRSTSESETESGVLQFKGSSSEWSNPDWIYCRDNKYRPIKPGIKPLVDGLPKGVVRGSDPSAPINADETQEARVMRLKGYGNAIVPQLAAEFIKCNLKT
jgi:DNA (cytosine-5)-methyltransferase 1